MLATYIHTYVHTYRAFKDCRKRRSSLDVPSRQPEVRAWASSPIARKANPPPSAAEERQHFQSRDPQRATSAPSDNKTRSRRKKRRASNVVMVYLRFFLLRQPVLGLGHGIQQLVLLLLCNVRLGLGPFGHLVLQFHQSIASLLHRLGTSSQLLEAVEYRIRFDPDTEARGGLG